MLEALGLTADEERVFRVLVGGYRAAPGEVAARLGLAVAEAEGLLVGLVAKRLVSRTGEHYVPAPPDVSLGPLLRHGQAELEVARVAVTELAEQYRDSARRRDSSRLVEVVTGAEAIRQQALSLQRDAREEVLWFCREAPIAMAAAENDEEFSALARGVRFRVLYETALLEEPGAMAGLAEGIRLGERARTIAKLPVRLAVADRALALCPLADDEATGEPTAALVLGSSLVTALVALFESYWERASPVRIDGVPGDAPLSPDERRLLSLLVGGVSDKSIAKHLGVSHRTVQRRLQDLMQRADAQSRMQLAWQVAKLGWLDS
ncbi:LuxR C-terminal-related transcriptional regulator [Amycolatopsis rhabdoformis]|uniref:LuxR C-terminal-related transcriptional regulator n=1 Tax=Amycolatopsis rhabdoformis TaxID=1448059 RepID=A0ABZ1IIM7_9PSEU|nr:LuxR C-terminal-related transcriptional regulator [Amycolatopsis rhabdoformis]WSE33578.1 LuxR C-terminal-related transcriptional regulator [Amycolatopsis rhabdoformis]